ncbi:uncharacterized protein LOC120372130 [Mauremys reevesii]|uniref:uncharacterized protein LOC120372130 n=1 Tax=Mauremys reevesii TaxID=260615 RepID=UPI00193FD000|nr:uncharacterized protein LOC120372130 [Mauremys reevesii]
MEKWREEKGSQKNAEQEGRARVDIMEMNGGTQERCMEQEGGAWEEVMQQAGGTRGQIMELDGRLQEEITESAMGAQRKIMELDGRAWEEVTEQAGGTRGKIMELGGRAQAEVMEQAGGDKGKMMELDGGAQVEVTELDGGAQAEVTEQAREGQEVGMKLVKDLLAVVATSALPQNEKTELEFVTLQFMIGGNVHLVGELLSHHTVEEFQQEVFARFPIPAFRVTSTVACNQATSRRAERGLSLHELGCSGQQDRIYSQLIFFLCRASSLTGWVGLDRLLEMLQQLKHCIYYIPVALVGVIVQEDPELDLEQEVKALQWLKCLLDGVFCCDLLPGHEGTEQEVQVQVAVYQSGWPQRALEVKRAACQAIRAALKF